MHMMLKYTLRILLICVSAVVCSGLMFWLATVRDEDFYLHTSFKSGAVASFWIRPSLEEEQKSKGAFSQADISVWFNPRRLNDALSGFGDWWNEFLLLTEESDDAAGSENQILPPFPLVPETEETVDSQFLVEDSYDSALAGFLEDVWSSGFLIFAGSVHFKVPVWAKPMAGLSVSFAQSGLSSLLIDSFVRRFPMRDDALDLPSWLVTIPYSNMVNYSSPIQDLVLDLGDAELSELFMRLCDLGNLAENFCDVDELENNPLAPLFLTSEGFHVQLKIHWTLRGQHIVWSNSKECIEKIISQPVGRDFSCGDESIPELVDTGRSLGPLMNSKDLSSKDNRRSSGVWINQRALHQAGKMIISELKTEPPEGILQMLELFSIGSKERSMQAIQDALTEWAYLWPVWAAEIDREDAATGKLLIHAMRPVRPLPDEVLAPQVAAVQFSFFNSVLNAWLGLASSTTRLVRSKPWSQVNGYWRSESDYRFGWSEQE